MSNQYPGGHQAEHVTQLTEGQRMVNEADGLIADVRELQYDDALEGSALQFTNGPDGQVVSVSQRDGSMTTTRSVSHDQSGLRVFTQQQLETYGAATPHIDGNYMVTVRVWGDSSGLLGADFARSEVQGGRFVTVSAMEAHDVNREKFAASMLDSVRDAADEVRVARGGQQNTDAPTEVLPVIRPAAGQAEGANVVDVVAPASARHEPASVAMYAGDRVPIDENHPHYALYMGREQARRAAMSGIPFASAHDALKYGADQMNSQLETRELPVVPPQVGQ